MNSFYQSRLESQRWQQSKQDNYKKEVRLAVVELTKKLAAGTHTIAWITWKARDEPSRLVENDFEAYDKKMETLFPDIVGSRILLAALDEKIHKKINPFLDELYKLDAQTAKARSSFRKSPQAGRIMLADYYDQVQVLNAKVLSAMTSWTDFRAMTSWTLS